MKKHSSVAAPIAMDSKIVQKKVANLSVHKLEILTPKKLETVHYYCRDGISELFDELVKPKMGESKFNVSLIGHPGTGKSNLVWAVEHYLVAKTEATVLWASRHDAAETWQLRLFERDTDENPRIYQLENAPKELRDILEEPVLEHLQVLILDAPTRTKSTHPPSDDGVAAFEWAGKEDQIDSRCVIHTSSLGAYSVDERMCILF